MMRRRDFPEDDHGGGGGLAAFAFVMVVVVAAAALWASAHPPARSDARLVLLGAHAAEISRAIAEE